SLALLLPVLSPRPRLLLLLLLFLNLPPPSELYTLSLHDALPIWPAGLTVPWPSDFRIFRLQFFQPFRLPVCRPHVRPLTSLPARSEEHTSELQSRFDLVCRLLLEKKNQQNDITLERSTAYIPRHY